MKRMLLAALAVLAGFASANAQALYNHNGSIMRVVEQGNTVRILYEQPRQGMAQIGVRPGTLLFEGELDANRYLEGLSRIFSARCGELDYYVYGQYQRSGDFTLNGAAPVLEAGGCRVIDNIYDGANANLFFAYLREAPGRSATPAPTLIEPASGFGPFCVAGVSTSLNMRAGPGGSFSVVGTLPANSCDIAGYNRCQDGWCFVARGPALGWVADRYLRPGR